ncbi:hypothetical protein H3146_01775 [Streptomyces sp. OF3]|uniref:Uncharacterized protein n=2 Tax=Streptomyces alkaliterrae TaxID=2213162 RepID=A0A7W3ZKR6_9ACTN|nr:hypothetical protein [Streptomyces alkaliterrae]
MSTQPTGEHRPPLLAMPDKHPAALRVAVSKIKPGVLKHFDEHWESAMTKAREEYSLLPGRAFTEHWWMWVAIYRNPALAERFEECERIVAEAEDSAERRDAAAELSRILALAAAEAEGS